MYISLTSFLLAHEHLLRAMSFNIILQCTHHSVLKYGSNENVNL
jgi:hypothetical protein